MANRISILALVGWYLCALPQSHAAPGYSVQLDVVSKGFDQKTCWVHPRAGTIPARAMGHREGDPTVVLTLNKLELTGNDVFHEINSMFTSDMGEKWSNPVGFPEALGRWENGDGTCRSICDFWPKWHSKSEKLLGIGHTVWYTEDNKVMVPRPRHTSYSVYDPQQHSWSERKDLIMPDEPRFANAGAGSSQRYDLPDGDILLPIYFKAPKEEQYSATVVLVRFDGETMDYVRHGDELTVPIGRGLYEPSMTRFKERYFLTIRGSKDGYVTSGTDGLEYDEPKKWAFDDGKPLGSYDTQQHWVTHSDALYLVYTRRGANNDHVFRHRAPLFMAQVDPERLCVLRDTERILVPEHGARLGNFGVTEVTENETWVTTAEWMQTTAPNNRDFRIPMKYGADNRVYAARIQWDTPNKLVVAAGD